MRTLTALSADDVLRIADETLNGFEGRTAAVGRQLRGALVEDETGRIAVLRPQGDHWSVRLLTHGAEVRQDGPILIVRPKETMFGEVRIDLGKDAAIWAEKIGRL